ncbi:MAG TPA: chemotaxis protein CheW [Candidatus Solibacter sp.]|nr:chemotaxis protein CheW [Candidatus Solibacter sp.]
MHVASPPLKLQTMRSEQIILFRVSGHLFAVSSASVQEVRSVDSLSGAATEINQPTIRKVRHVLRRGDKALYVINAAVHFGLPSSASGLVFVLRKTRTALLVDGMDKMATMTRLQSLPLAYCQEERHWYRGLTALDQNVIPVVNPDGFLTAEEFALLDASLPPLEIPDESLNGETELPQ